MKKYDKFPFRKKKEHDDILPEEWFDLLYQYIQQIYKVETAVRKRGSSHDNASFNKEELSPLWEILDSIGSDLLIGLRRYPKGEWPATLNLLAEFRPEAYELMVLGLQENSTAEELAGLARCKDLAERLNWMVPKSGGWE